MFGPECFPAFDSSHIIAFLTTFLTLLLGLAAVSTRNKGPFTAALKIPAFSTGKLMVKYGEEEKPAVCGFAEEAGEQIQERGLLQCSKFCSVKPW